MLSIREEEPRTLTPHGCYQCPGEMICGAGREERCSRVPSSIFSLHATTHPRRPAVRCTRYKKSRHEKQAYMPWQPGSVKGTCATRTPSWKKENFPGMHVCMLFKRVIWGRWSLLRWEPKRRRQSQGGGGIGEVHFRGQLCSCFFATHQVVCWLIPCVPACRCPLPFLCAVDFLCVDWECL